MQTQKINLSILLSFLIFLITACEKIDDLTPPIPITTPDLEEINGERLDSIFEVYLNGQIETGTPKPNQFNILSEERTQSDSIECNTTTASETSPEYSEILYPNSVSDYLLAAPTTLGSILDGSNIIIQNGLSGEREIRIESGSYIDTTTTDHKPNSIAFACSQLAQKLPQATPNIDIRIEQVYSEKHAFAKFKASGKNLFGSLTASAKFERSEFKYTYILALKVHDYDFFVTPPDSPRDWFGNLSEKDYEQLGDYRLVYADRVSYGKYLYMLVETNRDKFSVEAALQGAFGGALAGGEFDAEGRYSSLRNESRVVIKTIGGNAEWTAGLLSGESEVLGRYLKNLSEDKKGTYAAPLFASFRFLSDNSRAKVVLATDEYKIRDCYNIPSETMVYDSPDWHDYKFDLIGGDDGEFNGDGFPYIDANIYLELRNDNTELWLVNETYLYELRRNWTTGLASNVSDDNNDKLLLKTPNGKKIVRLVNNGQSSHVYQSKDNNRTRAELIPENGEFPHQYLVKKLMLNGDTAGPDLPSVRVFSDRSWMRFVLNKIVVEVR